MIPDATNPLDLLTHPLPNVHMYLSPPTLTKAEQDALLSATTGRDHLIFSLALGTGLRLAELVGLNVGDVYLDATPRQRIRLRREIAKGGRSGDVFLPDALILGRISMGSSPPSGCRTTS